MQTLEIAAILRDHEANTSQQLLAIMSAVAGSLSRGSAQAPRGAGDNVMRSTLTARGRRRFSGDGARHSSKHAAQRRNGRRVSSLSAVLGGDARGAARETGARLLEDADRRIRSIRGKPVARKRRSLNNHHRSRLGYAEISGEPHDTHRQGTCPSVIRTRPARANMRSAEPRNRRRSYLRLKGALQCDRGAYRRQDVRNAGQETAVRIRASASQYAAGRDVDTVGRDAALDVFTFQVAMAVLASNRPRVLVSGARRDR